MKITSFLVVLVTLISSFQHPPLTWVAIGDSITYLNDHPNETHYRVKKGYLTRVTDRLPWVHYVNQGHNGWTSGNIANEIDKLGITKADVYSIFLGTNDWWQGRPLGSLDDYKNNTGNNTVNGSFRIIVEKIRSLNSRAHIILVTPMQRNDFVFLDDMNNNAYGSYKEKKGQSLEQFANAIAAIAKFEHFDLIDLYHTRALRLERLVKFKRVMDTATGNYVDYKYPAFVNIPFDPKSKEYPYPAAAIGMTYDGLHPSDEGNAIIAEQFVKLLRH